jgi:methylglutaconyl-CoA hydratase
LNQLSGNADVSVIVLRSEGTGAFVCALTNFVSNLEEGTSFSLDLNLINAMRKCSKIIVGRIHGKAVGGGVGIAAACDYAFATIDSAIKLSELAIGIGPFVIEPAVSRKIKTAMTEMTLQPPNGKIQIGPMIKDFMPKYWQTR